MRHKSESELSLDGMHPDFCFFVGVAVGLNLSPAHDQPLALLEIISLN